jgi:hypothetical protein
MTTLPTDPDQLLSLMRSITERMLDPESDHVDTGDALQLAEAIRALDVALMNEDFTLPLPWRIRTANEVKRFLKDHRPDHIDKLTGELDCTGLEAAAEALNLHVPTPDVDVPEVLFELAADVGEDDACPDDPDGLHHLGCGCPDSDVIE